MYVHTIYSNYIRIVHSRYGVHCFNGSLPFITFLSAQEINNGVSQILFIVQIQFKNFSCRIKFIFAQIVCRKCNSQLFATNVLHKARTNAHPKAVIHLQSLLESHFRSTSAKMLGMKCYKVF